MTTVKIPTTPTEFEEVLATDSRVLAMLREGSFPEFVTSYANALAKRDPDLSAQITEQVQMGLAEWAQTNGSPTPRLDQTTTAFQHCAMYDKAAPGVVLDKEFGTDAKAFFLSAVPDKYRRPEDTAKWAKIRNDYSSVDPSKGGFLVPESIRSTLMMAALEQAVVLPGATVIPMDAPRVGMPAVDETTHNGSVYGGVSWAWVAEGQSLPESEGRFRRVLLDVSKLVSFCDAPAELVTDSPGAFGVFINRAMPNALAFGLDYAHLRGTGVGMPLGILDAGNTALVVVAKETNQPATTIVKANIDKMFARMLPSSLSSAVWIVAIDTFPQLVDLAVNTGTGGSPVWLNNGIKDAPPVTIYGRPVLFTEKSPTLGQQGDIAFVDRSQYLAGSLNTMRVDSSPHYRFGNDLISYRVIDRADGRPWFKSALTPANGSTNTLSPYVTLAVRS